MIPVNVAGTFPIWHYDCRPKDQALRMNYDDGTQLTRPERGGRLFLPRIAVGGRLDEVNILQAARGAGLESAERFGHSVESDAQLSNFLGCLLGRRLLEAHWDWRYLFTCIALNNVVFLRNP